MPRENVQTTFAMKATTLAEQYNDLFGHVKLDPGYVTDMTAPDGPSTGGGIQATQHIRLHSPDGVAPMVMGSVDSNTQKGVLRSYAYVRNLHEKRSQLPFSLNEKQYDEFIARVRSFCEVMQFKITIESPPAEAIAPARTTTAAARPQAASAPVGMDPFWKGFAVGMLVGAFAAAGLVVVLRAVLG